jgi:hypothetical protein
MLPNIYVIQVVKNELDSAKKSNLLRGRLLATRYVLNTSVNDLEKWTDLVNGKYLIQFYDARIDSTTDKISFKAIEETWTEGNRELVFATVKVGTININCHFYGHGEIENDIDPREFKSLTDHDNLINYLKELSNLLYKEVIVTNENTKDSILIRVAGDKVIYEGA